MIKYLIRSNIFVAICAASLSWQTLLVYGKPIDQIYETLTVFFGTWFVYNMHRYVKKGVGESGKWPFDSHVVYMMISGIALIPILFFLKESALILMVICALVTITYSINVVRIKGKWRNLRQGYLKPISVVIMWTVLTVIFPLLGEPIWSKEVLLLSTERFLFLLAITLPFDVRDIIVDERSGIQTVPLLIGWKKTIDLSLVFIVSFAMIAIVSFILNVQNIYVLMAYVGSALITFMALRKTNPQLTGMHYSFTLEGMSLIQTLLVSGLLLSGLR